MDGYSGSLPPCPESPNCVSTTSNDYRHAMPALPYLGARKESMQWIIAIIEGMKGCELIVQPYSHLQVQFTTRVFRFVDDRNFFLMKPPGWFIFVRPQGSDIRLKTLIKIPPLNSLPI